VAALRFSRRAEADLLSGVSYTLRTWGEDQADRYIDNLERCCRMLAESPGLGRASDSVRPGLRRMECGTSFTTGGRMAVFCFARPSPEHVARKNTGK